MALWRPTVRGTFDADRQVRRDWIIVILSRRIASLLLLASLLAPGAAVVAEAGHVALHHEPADSPAAVAGDLNLLRHGHAHDDGTAEHGHPLLVAGSTGVRTPPRVANEFGDAAWQSADIAIVVRTRSRFVAAEPGGVGPPPPPRSISILRI